MPKTEIRKLLKQQRSERQREKRVEHPFAKYDAQDQLMCVVCQSQVKSVWSTHLTSAYHKENMARLRSIKQQKQQQQQQKRPMKRTSSPVPEETSIKRAKHHEPHNVDEVEQDEEMEHDDDNETSQQLPADFFDSAPSKQQISDDEEDDNDDEEEEDKKEERSKPSQPKKQEQKKPQQQGGGRGAGSNLPQGFFDDPEEEARIRNKAPIAEQVENILDEEYSLFKEAMADTIIESEKVDEEEDEELWLDRDEEMFRQQAEFDSRVENLKKMRVQGISATTKKRENKNNRVDDDDDDDDMEREMKNGLKKGVRNVLKKAPSKKITTVFDDMDISSDDEEEEDDDWRAQQL